MPKEPAFVIYVTEPMRAAIEHALRQQYIAVRAIDGPLGLIEVCLAAVLNAQPVHTQMTKDEVDRWLNGKGDGPPSD